MQISDRRFIVLDVVSSTNNYVAKALESGQYEAGTVILAHFQSQGKGQRGNVWHSSSGLNLTFSVAIAIEALPVHRQFLLSKAISIGLNSAVQSILQLETHIKWPNDILVNSKKIAGILIEVKKISQRYAIVGIGLNVNQDIFGDLNKATSLSLELGRELNVMNVLEKVVLYLNKALHQLGRQEYDFINAQYAEMMFKRGSWMTFSLSERTFEGMISDVDEQGMLLVRSRQGHVDTYAPKEISINY